MSPLGQALDGDLMVQVSLHPGQQRREIVTVAGTARYRSPDVLGLPAIAMGRYDHAASDGIGDLGAQLVADDVETGVDAGRSRWLMRRYLPEP